MLRFLLLLLIPLAFSPDNPPSRPLDRHISFSGNYGELRDGRFHAGLDFRTGGVTGEKIYSIGEGYVYRASVSSTGYGNGLYIKHPDGSVSIYGHMLEFAPEIGERVRTEQYSKKKFQVNLYFEPGEIPVQAHQYIGRVGNSGSSGAPHLHLELRDPSGKGPVNPIARGYFDIKDGTPPVIRQVNFYSYTDTLGVPQTSLIASFEGKTKKVVEVGERSYIAVDAVDRQSGTPAKLAVESYQVFLDDSLLYRFDLGDYTFEEQECFCSLIEYSEKLRSGANMIKSWVECGNGFAPAKVQSRDRGLIVLKDNEIHSVKIIVADFFGNSASRSFKVRRGGAGEKPQGYIAPAQEHLYGTFLPWFAPLAFNGYGIKLSLPVEAFFSSVYFTIDKTADPSGYSAVWKIGDEGTALKKSGKVEIDAALPKALQSKAFIAAISPDGSISYCGGKYSQGAVKGRIPGLGRYKVAVDTVAPVITPRFNSPAAIRRSGQAAFTIEDALSGIKSYEASVDGVWILSGYDKKYDKLTVWIDPKVVTSRGEHSLEVKITDNKGNISSYNTTFKW